MERLLTSAELINELDKPELDDKIIRFEFWEEETHDYLVAISDIEHPKIGTAKIFKIIEFDKVEDYLGDYVKEAQSLKRKIQRYFNNRKVTSDLKYK